VIFGFASAEGEEETAIKGKASINIEEKRAHYLPLVVRREKRGGSLHFPRGGRKPSYQSGGGVVGWHQLVERGEVERKEACSNKRKGGGQSERGHFEMHQFKRGSVPFFPVVDKGGCESSSVVPETGGERGKKRLISSYP